MSRMTPSRSSTQAASPAPTAPARLITRIYPPQPPQPVLTVPYAFCATGLAGTRGDEDWEVEVDASQAQRVLDHVEQDATVALLQALVRDPSVNPPGDVRASVRICADKLA